MLRIKTVIHAAVFAAVLMPVGNWGSGTYGQDGAALAGLGSGLLELLGQLSPLIWDAVGLLLLFGFAKWMKDYVGTAKYKQAVEALREGIDRAQEEYVTWWKRANADGKLSRQERHEAMRIALSHAKSITVGTPVGELVASWTWSKVNTLIKQLLEDKKSGAASGIASRATGEGDSATVIEEPVADQ